MLALVGLQPEGPPDPADRGLAHARRRRHRARRPVRRVRGLSSRVFTITLSTSSSVTWRGLPGRGSSCRPSMPHSANRPRHLPTVERVAAKADCDLLAFLSVGRRQHDPAAQRQGLGALRAPGPALQHLPLLAFEHDIYTSGHEASHRRLRWRRVRRADSYACELMTQVTRPGRSLSDDASGRCRRIRAFRRASSRRAPNRRRPPPTGGDSTLSATGRASSSVRCIACLNRSSSRAFSRKKTEPKATWRCSSRATFWNPSTKAGSVPSRSL